MSDMSKAILSMLVGWSFATFVGLGVFQFTQNFIITQGWPAEMGSISGAGGFILSLIYIGYYGMRRLGYLDNGVPLLLDQRIKIHLLPPGRSWWIPSPLGGYIRTYVGQRTLDQTNKATNPITQVLSGDNLEVSVSIMIQWTVINPYKFSGLETPEVAFEGLINRNVRWYVSINNGEEMPSKREELAAMIKGEVIEINDRNGQKVHTGNHVVATASDWGIRIDYALCDEVNLPTDIVNAWEQKRVEKSQEEYEMTETENVLRLMEKYREKFPNLTDQEILNAVQVERDKTQRVLVEGGGGDFTKGGALQAGYGKPKGGKRK